MMTNAPLSGRGDRNNVPKNERGKRKTPSTFCLVGDEPSYFAASSGFLRLSQLYLRWNFSTRPVVSTNFILPVKNGWQAEQISTVIFCRVLRVTNLLPQPQVTVVSSYLG